MEGNDGIIKNIKENTIIVDHTTASADIARKYYQKAKEKIFIFLTPQFLVVKQEQKMVFYQ